MKGLKKFDLGLRKLDSGSLWIKCYRCKEILYKGDSELQKTERCPFCKVKFTKKQRETLWVSLFTCKNSLNRLFLLY